MNMITCGLDCAYQKDGFCCLDGCARITETDGSLCCYYEKKDGEKEVGARDKDN